MMSAPRTGLFAGAALAALALVLSRLFGPRPLRREAPSPVPQAWRALLARYMPSNQVDYLVLGLSMLKPLNTAGAHDLLARYLTPAQLASITADPAWVQGQHELVVQGMTP